MSILPQTYGNYPTYTFYITYGTFVTQVYPLNFNESTLVDTQEKSEVFYRRKFVGILTFTNNNGSADFDYFYAIETIASCTKLYLLIERDGVDYWDGYFSTTEGAFDIDRCVFEVTPLPNDDYTPILDISDKQYNILLVGTVVATHAYKVGVVNQVYSRNRWLWDVIQWLGNDATYGIVPACTVSSTFFTAANNPATLNASHTTLLTIAQKSDIIRPASTDPATTALLSWDELMGILWAMFQVKWNYDVVTDTINVEHISWFGTAAGLDLQTQLMTEATNKYAYLKEIMPKYEKFAFAEADGRNFVGEPILYESGCVNQDPDSNITETFINVTTDLEYILTNPDAINDEGFVILCNYDAGGADYHVELQLGALEDDIVALNMHLSWANLMDCYFRHERVLIQGYMNGLITTFWTALRTKIQKCSAIICPSDDYDPSDEITTELGETYFGGIKARVKQSTLHPSGEINFDLVYGPAENVNTGVADLFGVYGVLTFPAGTNFNLELQYTGECPASVDIRIKEYLYDELGAGQCSGAWHDITLTAGVRGETINVAMCGTLDAGHHALLDIEYCLAEIHNFDLTPDPTYSMPVPFVYDNTYCI